MTGPEGTPLILHHTTCGHDMRAVVCSVCAEQLDVKAVRARTGPATSSAASSADIPELNDTGNPVPNPRLPVLRACRRDLGTTWRWDRALEDQFKTIAFVVLFTDMSEARMPYERKRGLVGWTDRGTEYSRPGGCRPLPHTVGGLRC